MSEEDISRFYPSARAIIRACAKYNELGIPLNRVHLFLDPKTLEYEVTAVKRSKRISHYFGTLQELDPAELLVESDAESAYVIDCIADIIVDAVEGYLNGETL